MLQIKIKNIEIEIDMFENQHVLFFKITRLWDSYVIFINHLILKKEKLKMVGVQKKTKKVGTFINNLLSQVSHE